VLEIPIFFLNFFKVGVLVISCAFLDDFFLTTQIFSDSQKIR